MSDILSKLNGPELTGLVAVVGGLLMAIIGIVAVQWRRVRIAEVECALKQQMLDKGMSAAEIEQIIKAGEKPERANPLLTMSSNDDRAALARNMVEQGYDSSDIERVLKAYQLTAKPIEEKPVAN
jgi:hypothetical protein